MTDPPSTTATTAALYGLVIGVDHYLNVGPDLHGCVGDALSVRDFLVGRVGIPQANLRTLLAPLPTPTAKPTGLDPAAVRPAASGEILAAFKELTSVVCAGDQVVVFFAGHGVRTDNSATGERVYGFAVTDTSRLPDGGFAHTIADRDLNAFLHGLTDAGAAVTVLADTCHSGGATRSLDEAVRGLPIERLSPAAWQAFVATQPALCGAAPAAARGLSNGGSGWPDPGGKDRDWVIFSACRDTEVANESNGHGAFTLSLLNELARTPPETIKSLRWLDFAPSVQGAVRAQHPDQTPVLEGLPEKTVFGGAWTPFEPGFTVLGVSPAGVVALDGGSFHGLDVGAEIAIYPPRTPDFDAADAAGVQPVRATIDSAAPATSTARLLDENAPVAQGSRAKLVKPSPNAARLGVRLTDVPAAIGDAIMSAPGAADRLVIGPSARTPDVEVLPWSRAIPAWDGKGMPTWVGATGGWALVPCAPVRGQVTPDDVIAYLPPPGAPGVMDAASVGQAMGRGLVRWAHYLDVLRRTRTDASLRGLVDVAVRVGKGASALTQGAACPLRAPNAAGIYEVDADEDLWIELSASAPSSGRLFGGILACSNDGNIFVTWPKQGADPALGGVGATEEGLSVRQVVDVGADRFKAAVLQVRADQATSLYTFKVVAYLAPDGEEPMQLASLALGDSVADVIVRSLGRVTRGGLVGDFPPSPPSVPLLCTWDLPVRVRAVNRA